MNLLQLAPGGTFGRLIVWTEPAFKELQALFGSFKAGSEMKKGYHLMRPMMTNADLGRIINSDEVCKPWSEPPLDGVESAEMAVRCERMRSELSAFWQRPCPGLWNESTNVRMYES